MNSNQNINISFNIDVNDVMDKTVNPLIGRASQTIISLWNMTFGLIDHFNDKINIKRELELESFKEKLESNTNAIPKENFKNPDIHIVGPALEKSKYFYNEEELRNMFAKLISSNMDNRLNGYLHPSFSSIISEMNSTDAKVLSTINGNDKFSKTIANIIFKSNANSAIFTPYKTNFYLPYSEIDYEEASSSISNLERLGLIKIDYNFHFSDTSIYEPYKESLLYKACLIEHIQKKETDTVLANYQLDIQHGRITITKYGENFIKTCL